MILHVCTCGPPREIHALLGISRTPGSSKEGNKHEKCWERRGEKERRANFMRCRERREEQKACDWAEKSKTRAKGPHVHPSIEMRLSRRLCKLLSGAPPHPMPTLEIKEFETGCEPLPTLCQLVFFFIEPIPPSPPL